MLSVVCCCSVVILCGSHLNCADQCCAYYKAPNLFHLVAAMMELKACGEDDHDGLVKQWNAENPSSNRLVGRKAVAVKTILEKLPKHLWEMLYSLVGEWGFENQPFTEDSVANRKIYPGRQFKRQNGTGPCTTEQ